MTSDDRLTSGLIPDMLDVLERRGCHRYDNRHTGQAVGAILDPTLVLTQSSSLISGSCGKPSPSSMLMA